MHEHGCLHFHMQNKNLYKTAKKVNTASVKNRTQEQILNQFKL
jgi:hypothetical protein